MANRRSTSCKSTVQSDCSVPACRGTSQKPKSEGKRLNTFNNLPTPHNVGPIQLAKCGFIYEGSNSTVRCTNCRKTIKQWETGDNPEDQQFHEEGCDFAEKMDTSPSDLAQSAGVTSEPERMEDSPTVAASPAARLPRTTDESEFLSLRNRKISRESPQPTSMPPMHIRGRQRPVPPSLTSEASEELLSRLTPVDMIRAIRSDDSVSSNSVRNFNVEPSRNGNRRVVQPEPIHTRPQDTNQPSSSRQVPPPQRNPSSTDLPDEEARPPDMRVARNRLRTFERFWSTKNIFKNIRLLVICGFFCLGHDDAVQCFYCNEILANWTRNDDPRRRHLECSPECRFAKGENCGDIPLSPERRIRRSPRQSSTTVQESSPPSHRESSPQQDPLPNAGTRTQPEFSLPEAYVELTPAQRERNNLMIEFPCEHPMNEAMRDEQVRLQSFQNSPFRQNTRLRASNQTLAQAGLYYDGFGDGTKCWCCGGGLKDYLQNDDPWVEHAKFYPECEYLLQQRGPAWVTSISIQHPNVVRPALPQREVNAVPAASSVSSGYGASGSGYGFTRSSMTNEVILENAMQTHPVQYARNMGFPEQLIREVQLRRILLFGSCYQNAETLTAALLNPDADPATLETASPQHLGISHSSRPQRRTITITGGNFVGPSIIDGHIQPRSRNTLTINGMSVQEYLANQGNAMEAEPEYSHSPVHIIDGSGSGGTPQVAPSTASVPTVNPPSPSSTTGTAAAPPSGSAEERLEALQRQLQCKICYSAPAQILFQPCGHICACTDCARRLNACPVCRQRIFRYLRTYPS